MTERRADPGFICGTPPPPIMKRCQPLSRWFRSDHSEQQGPYLPLVSDTLIATTITDAIS